MTIDAENGESPAWQFDAQYSFGDRLMVASRLIDHAKPIQSLPRPVNCSSRLIIGPIQ